MGLWMRYYPMFVSLEGRACLVVGAGQVGLRKIETLADCGAASVLVVDKNPPDEALGQLLARPGLRSRLCFVQRDFEEADLDGMFLAIASTSSPAVNQRISELCRERGVLCNIVDQPEACSFIVPALVRRGDLTLAISTGGQSPALAKRIRKEDVYKRQALYYLACLLESGEDPRFICRRLVLSSSEDIGLGDPQALPLAVACQQAVEFVGMPEGFIPLAETVIYLALAPKNNASYAAYLNALKEVRENGLQPVPLHLRNASTTLHKEWGYGRGYKYPHAFPQAWVEQEYLPHELAQRKAQFYFPKNEGAESRLHAWLTSRKRTPRKP